VVADGLAHTQVSVTLDVYSHVTATMQRQAVDTLDRVLGGQNGGHSIRPAGKAAGEPS
jgi:hypothetical protein